MRMEVCVYLAVSLVCESVLGRQYNDHLLVAKFYLRILISRFNR